METKGEDTTSTFSFGTESPWLGLDIKTLQIHSRARVLQSKQRAERLRRKNVELERLLDTARVKRRVELDLRTQTPRVRNISAQDDQASDEVIHLRAEEIDLRIGHESTDRDRLVVLRQSQPRAATATGRWG